jgi:hypothetical protein
MDSDDLSPAEAARGRRRDRDAEAHARAGMKTGLAKQFKQILDTQAKRAKAADDGHPTASQQSRLEAKTPSEHRSKRNPRTNG